MMEPLATFLPAVMLILVASIVIALRLPRGSTPVVFLIIFMTFHGFFSNLYDRHPLVHASKFIVLAFISISWLIRHGRPTPGRRAAPTPVDGPVKVLAAVYAFQMFNPYWSSLDVGILSGVVGIAQFLLPMSLFFLSRDVVAQRRHLPYLLMLMVGLCGVMAAFGLVQYMLGYEFVASLGPGFQDTMRREHTWFREQGGLEDYFRPMSFAQDAGAASKYYTMGIIGAASLLVPGASLWRLWPLLGVIALQAVALWLTLVRSSVVGVFIGLMVVLWCQRRMGHVVMVGALLLGFYAATGLSERPLWQRYEGLLGPTAYIEGRGMHLEAIWWVATSYPLGMGIGRAGPGAGMFMAPEDRQYQFPSENNFVCILFETGLVGGILMFWILLKICTEAIGIVRRLKDSTLRGPAGGLAAVVISIGVMSLAGPTMYATPTNCLFWAFAGLLYKVGWLDQAFAVGAPAGSAAGTASLPKAADSRGRLAVREGGPASVPPIRPLPA
jgi:hypothetical protein